MCVRTCYIENVHLVQYAYGEAGVCNMYIHACSYVLHFRLMCMNTTSDVIPRVHNMYSWLYYVLAVLHCVYVFLCSHSI